MDVFNISEYITIVRKGLTSSNAQGPAEANKGTTYNIEFHKLIRKNYNSINKREY